MQISGTSAWGNGWQLIKYTTDPEGVDAEYIGFFVDEESVIKIKNILDNINE